jgi:hypothetical protein
MHRASLSVKTVALLFDHFLQFDYVHTPGWLDSEQ